MPASLAGKEILLVGGAGGLGQATRALLAAEQARLVVTYRQNRERAEAPADGAVVVSADICQADDRARLLDRCPELYGLVIFTGDPARVSDPSQFAALAARSWEVNFLGPIALARQAAAQMREKGTPGAIVLFSTMQAVSLFPGSTAYASAKAGLQHAAQILAKESRGPANIRVNVICPGVTAAGMAEASIASGKYDRYLTEGLVPRFGRAGDIARAVRFFLEPDNYVTGQVLTVDGGLAL